MTPKTKAQVTCSWIDSSVKKLNSTAVIDSSALTQVAISQIIRLHWVRAATAEQSMGREPVIINPDHH